MRKTLIRILNKLPSVGKHLPLMAFFVILILIGGFSFKLSKDVFNISNVINEFYEHPYTVRNAINEFHLATDELVNIYTGHNGKHYVQSELKKNIENQFELIEASYSTIKSRYLGPEKDHIELLASYLNLKNFILTKGYDYGGIGHEEAIHDEMNQFLFEVKNKLTPLENYAINKAEDFRNASSLEKENLSEWLYAFYFSIVLFFILVAFIAWYIIISKEGSLFSEKQKFDKTIVDAPIPIMVHSGGKVLQISKEWERISGYSIDDIPTIELWSRKAYGEKHIPSKEFIMDLYKLEKVQDDGLWAIKTKSGEERLWRFHSGPLGDDTAISTAIDVTEEVKSVEKIKELQEQALKLAKAVTHSPVSIVITDTKGNIEYVNEYFSKITGYSSEEAIGNNPKVLKSGIHPASFYKNLWETISSGESWTGEMQNKAKDGTIFWESVSISPILNDDKDIINYVAIKENITEKKRLFEQVELSEKLKTSVIDTIREGLVFQDTSAKIILANEAACDILGLSMNQLLGVTSYHPSWRASNSLGQPIKGEDHPAVITLKTGQRINDFIMNVNTGENVKKTISINSRPLRDKVGNINGVVTTFRDITEREKMEESILYNEKFKDSILSSMKEGLIVQDNNYNTMLANNSACEIFELSLEHLKKAGPWDEGWQALSVDGNEIPNEDFPVIKAISTGNSVDNFIMNLKMNEDKRKFLSISSRPIKNENGEVIQAVSTFRDITDVIESNNALVESEKKYKDLFSLSTDPCLIIKDGIFTDCNKATINLLGMKSKKELIGLKPIDISPEYQADGTRSDVGVIEEIRKAREQKHLRFEWLHQKVNGELIPVEVMLTEIEDKDENFLYVVWRDITSRKNYERKIEESLEEKKVLLAEIHHRVKNNLAVISGMLELQAFTSNNSKEVEELAKSVYRIRSIAIIHEQLYKTGNFSAISIDESTITQIDSLVKMYEGKGESINVNYEMDKIELNVNQAIPFGLLVNELTTNALKYAFKGVSKPVLKISLRQINQDIEFTIQDNGIGFDVEKFKNAEDSLGHSLIEAFIAQLEGNLDIKSEPNMGTIMTVTFTPVIKKGSSSNLEIKRHK